MTKIRKILIGTNNEGKYREICDLLPNTVEKHSTQEFNLSSPEETGKSFEENSFIKASCFSKKTNLICLSDDSGLEIDILNGKPGIYSSRWGGQKKNFNFAIEKIFKEIKKNKNFNKKNSARFICAMTIYWPNGSSITTRGIAEGTISLKKKGVNGFGYDPIFIPNEYNQTFAEMDPKLKMSIDHRNDAFAKIKKYFI